MNVRIPKFSHTPFSDYFRSRKLDSSNPFYVVFHRSDKETEDKAYNIYFENPRKGGIKT